jgi:hypothetical protein
MKFTIIPILSLLALSSMLARAHPVNTLEKRILVDHGLIARRPWV